MQNRSLHFMYQIKTYKGIFKQTDEGMCYHYTSRLNLEHIPSLVFNRDNMKRSENVCFDGITNWRYD